MTVPVPHQPMETSAIPGRPGRRAPLLGCLGIAEVAILRGLKAAFLGMLLMVAGWAQSPQDLPQAAVALAHRAEKLKDAFRSGNPTALRSATLEVELLRRDYGTLDILPLVEAMAIWARHEGQQGRSEVGLRTIQHLERWAPKHPILLSSRVILLRQTGTKGYIESLPDVYELTRLRLGHEIHRWLFLAQHLAWIRLLGALLLWGWTLGMLLRYRYAFRYIWEQPFTKKVPHGGVRALVCASILAAPVLIGLDPSICALFWLWLTVPFMLGSELKYSLLIILLQLVHPLLAVLEPMAIESPRPSLLELQMQPQHKGLDWDQFKGMSAEDKTYLLGWQALQSKRWADAEALFASIRATHPFRAGVLNNLGVAMHQQDRKADAQKLFDEAAKLGGPWVELLLNQSILAFSQLDSPLGEAKQAEAKKANPLLYQQITEATQSRTDQRTYPIPLPSTPQLEEVLVQRYKPADSVASWRGPRSTLVFWTILPLLSAALLVWRARQSIREAHPTQCIRCGDPFHTTDSPDVEVCSKCHHLFIVKDGLHNESRKLKVDEVAAYQGEQRWIHRIILVLLPGVDLLFLGKTRQGMVEFVIFCLALGVVLGTGRSVRYPGEILPDPTTIWLPLGLGLLGILFFRSWLKLIPRR